MASTSRRHSYPQVPQTSLETAGIMIAFLAHAHTNRRMKGRKKETLAFLAKVSETKKCDESKVQYDDLEFRNTTSVLLVWLCTKRPYIKRFDLLKRY